MSIKKESLTIQGHSFGGATSLAVANSDKRFSCSISYDAWFGPHGKKIMSD